MTLRKIKEIDDQALNGGPKTNRTSRTINQSVASKRYSMIEEPREELKNLKTDNSPQRADNVFIMDHL